MTIVLFILYSIIFSWLLTRIGFIRKTGLAPAFVVSLFMLKVIAGVAYGYVHATAPQHVGTTDTWKFFYQGMEETAMLKADPSAFFHDLLPKRVHEGFGGLFSTSNSYWNDIKHELMVKLASVLNLLSGSDYYVNLIPFNFLTFFGPIALYRTLQDKLGSFTAIAISFLLPTFLFWGSGFHKEGLIFVGISSIIYILSRKGKWGAEHVAAFCLSVLGIMLLRNNLILPLVPSVLAFLVTRQTSLSPSRVFAFTILACICLFFLSPFAGVDLPASVSNRQTEFIALGGRTAVQVPLLEPTPMGFLHNLPSALNIGFLRPFLLEGGVRYLPFSLELYALLAFFIFMLLRRIKNHPHTGTAFLLLSTGLLTIIMIGYTVPNLGAVVRYRSVVLPLLFAGMALLAKPLQKQINI